MWYLYLGTFWGTVGGRGRGVACTTCVAASGTISAAPQFPFQTFREKDDRALVLEEGERNQGSGDGVPAGDGPVAVESATNGLSSTLPIFLAFRLPKKNRKFFRLHTTESVDDCRRKSHPGLHESGQRGRERSQP